MTIDAPSMPAPRTTTGPDEDNDAALRSKILELLAENRIMSIATVRPDGWPQATTVGYINQGLDVYFLIARESQKLANIQRESRVSIAIARDGPDHIRGLSMAAYATEVTDYGEIRRINDLVFARYPEQAVFAPRETSCALMRAAPTIVSLIDHSKGPGEPILVEVGPKDSVRRSG